MIKPESFVLSFGCHVLSPIMAAISQRDKRVTARDIADDLRDQIRAGVLAEGHAIPTSKELAAKYGVSIRTTSLAADILKREGLLVGEAGGRRRVRSRRLITWNLSSYEIGTRRDSQEMDDWSRAIADAGRVPEQRVTVTEEAASSKVAKWLRLEVGAPVVQRHRVRLVDDMPLQLSTSWFPAHIAHGSPLMEERDISIPGGILRSIGHPQVKLRDEIVIRMPTPEETEILDLPVGTPVAEHLRIGYGEVEPVRAMVTIAPGDRHLLVYEQRA